MILKLIRMEVQIDDELYGIIAKRNFPTASDLLADNESLGHQLISNVLVMRYAVLLNFR